MIAMQMRNKNVIDPAFSDLVTAHLHLCSLATINENQVFSGLQNLCGGMPVV
jgi:hypothetical protein